MAPYAYLLGCQALVNMPEIYRYTKTVYQTVNLMLNQANTKEILHWKQFFHQQLKV